jgi:hypothetical protein
MAENNSKEIRIQINDETAQLKVDVEGLITFPELARALFTTLLHFMECTAEQGKDVPELRGEIYDMVNALASNTLDAFEPEPANGADKLTAEAILRAENEILTEAVAETEEVNSEE